MGIPKEQLELRQKNVHVVGIKGMGTSALAALYAQMGYTVTGSDFPITSVADKLLQQYKNITVFPDFNEKNVSHPDFVVHSVAYDATNPEIHSALEQKIAIFTYPQAVGNLLSSRQAIAVSGTNGKTTTTGMLATILLHAGMDPTYLVGALLRNDLESARLGCGPYFVIEADEYREAFLQYAHAVEMAIITNIDFDHPDYYANLDEVLSAFTRFLERVPDHARVYLCGEDKGNQMLLARTKRKFITYGFTSENNWYVNDLVSETETQSLRVCTSSVAEEYKILLPGKHNVLNALAAIAVARSMGVSRPLIQEGLLLFKGARRRFEILFDNGVQTVIDDYAHHPTAIQATLAAVRQRYPKRRVVAIFQPHTFSRTQALVEEFAQAFSDAEELYYLDIFPSSREKKGDFNFSIGELVERTERYHKSVKFIDDPEMFVNSMLQRGNEPFVLVTIGAGDIWETIAEKISKIWRGDVRC
jgi:UDP-N-acetylmuramate--alanine ligase